MNAPVCKPAPILNLLTALAEAGIEPDMELDENEGCIGIDIPDTDFWIRIDRDSSDAGWLTYVVDASGDRSSYYDFELGDRWRGPLDAEIVTWVKGLRSGEIDPLSGTPA